MRGESGLYRQEAWCEESLSGHRTTVAAAAATEAESDDVTHKQNISKEQCICLAKILQYIHQIVVRMLPDVIY